MKKTLFGLLILAILSSNLYSQSDFRGGYLIDNSSDTIFGTINYKGNAISATKCIFKKTENSEKMEFSPEEIKGYRFTNGKFYISKKVEKDGESNSLFLEYLINATVDIYYYRDSDGENYLIDYGTGELYELKNDEIEIQANGTNYLQKSEEYKRVLKFVFQDSPTASKKINNTKLSHKSLIDLTREYHYEVCENEECIIYEKKIPKVITKYGLQTGMYSTSIVETKDIPLEYYYLNDLDYNTSNKFSIGVFVKRSLPGLNEKYHLQYEGIISSMEFHGSSTYVEPVYKISYSNNIIFSQTVFANSFMLRYETAKAKFRPTFQFGGFLNYFFNVEYQRDMEERWSWGDIRSTNTITESPYSKFDYGIVLGAGMATEIFRDRDVYIDIRYQRGFGMLDVNNTNIFNITLGFEIFSNQ